MKDSRIRISGEVVGTLVLACMMLYGPEGEGVTRFNLVGAVIFLSIQISRSIDKLKGEIFGRSDY